MKPVKGLKRDYKALEQEPGSYPFGKNGTWNANTKACQNENGFKVMSANIPYKVIGVVETDKDPIIFSTDGTYSAIGFYNESSDTYISKVNDQFLSYKLGFRLDKYILGEARRNYKNNIEVSWIDKYNVVRFADLEELPGSLDEYKLFPESSSPDVELQLSNGGTLGLGAYYAAVKYSSISGTETRYGTPSNPIFAISSNFGALPGTSTGKALKIILKNLDTRYQYAQVAIIKKIKGVTTVVELPEVSTGSSVTLTYTGNEGIDITLEEVLIPAGFYNNANNIGQQQDSLYLADMTESAVLNLQKYANMIQVNWKSMYIPNIEGNDDIKSGKIRTFKHGEVYGLYVVFELASGQKTGGFHIPGIAPSGSDLNTNSAAASEGFTAKNYQIDTLGLTNINTGERTGRTGVWVNTTEVYPNLPEFNSSDIGGEDLRGTSVRHHKLPTLSQTATLFGASSGFGITGLDVLGLSIGSIVLPPELQGVVISYELFYARRDYSNATILSQGLTIYPAKSGFTGEDLYFTGGNYEQRMLRSDFSSGNSGRTLRNSNTAFKLHHADLIVNRPAVTPTFLASNYKIQADITLSQATRDSVDELNFKSDFVSKGKILATNREIKGIKDTGYLLNNGSKGLIKNIKSEDGFVGSFNSTGFTIAIAESIHGGRQTEGDSKPPDFEQSNLVDVCVVRDDLYVTFNTQDLVKTGVKGSIDATKPKEFSFQGDYFLIIHSYFSYGLAESVDRFASNPGRVDGIGAKDEDTYTDEFYLGTSGVKVARRYVTESAINMWQRYIDPAIPESKFWPAVNADALNGMGRNKDNNLIAISREANSIGDLLNGIQPYDYKQVNISSSPYKIIRSQQQSKEGKKNSWKNFNPLDYYETEKIWGPIMNIVGFGERLIIHFRNALFLTQSATTLKSDILEVTLGSGDLFRMPPRQGKNSRKGYAGTQHQLACIVTEFGYVFPDAETGIWFVLNEEGLQELNDGMYNFFQEFLNIPEINPFIGNGITVGYDNKLKRLLVTVKNKKQSGDYYLPNYEETPEFFKKLIPGQSIVFKNGRYQKFLGVNTSAFSCKVFPTPTLQNYSWTLPELSDRLTLVGTLLAANFEGNISYSIASGNTLGGFSIDASSGKILVNNSEVIDTLITSGFVLEITVKDTHGHTVNATAAITLTPVTRAPVVPNYTVEINENSAVNSDVQQIIGTDPKGLSLTYSIESQSVAGAVKINSATGQLSINDASKFNYEVNPVITILVRVANSGKYTISTVVIVVKNVNESPSTFNSSVTILDTVTGTAAVYTEPVDVDGDATVVTMQSQSVTNAFQLNTVGRILMLNPDHTLDPVNSPYIVTLRATDGGGLYSDFVITINVLYSPNTLANQKFTFSCTAVSGFNGTKTILTNKIISSRFTDRDVYVYNNINPAGNFQPGTIGEYPLAYYPEETESPDCPI